MSIDIMQKKILKALKPKKVGSHPNVSKKLPKDEYAVGMKDVYKELSYWGALGKFIGKDIICPCDWDIVDGENIYAIEIIYGGRASDGLPSSVEVYRCDGESITCESIPADKIEHFVYYKLSCNFLRTLTQHAEDWGIKSITASGYNPVTGLGFPYQSIDFSMYDVCITNPPRSLYSNLVESVIGKIDFIILSPFLNRSHTIPSIPLMLKQAYLGKGRRISPNFHNVALEDKPINKDLCCDWLVSYPDAQTVVDATRLVNGIKYDLYKGGYSLMDNLTMKDGTHPIKINDITTIPDDFYGWMLCAVGILDKLSNEEFEWYPTQGRPYFNKVNPSSSPYAHKMTVENMKVSWKDGSVYDGVVIRRRS